MEEDSGFIEKCLFQIYKEKKGLGAWISSITYQTLCYVMFKIYETILVGDS